MRRTMVLVMLAACAQGGSNRIGPQDANPGDPDGSNGGSDGSGSDIDAAQHINAPAATGTHLVINEVDYDQVGTDTTEYIEILNPTGAAISLTGISVMLANGANNAVYSTFDLSSQGSLAAGGYLVIGGASLTVAGGALLVTPTGWKTQDNVQNGNPDGLAIVDTAGPTVIDALSYGGAMTAANLTGFGNPVSLVEGTATSKTDNNTTPGSMCRTPNGADTDNASVDWAYCTTLTPGAPN